MILQILNNYVFYRQFCMKQEKQILFILTELFTLRYEAYRQVSLGSKYPIR